MIQNFKNFKNNSMQNRINESQDVENSISAFYDNQIKQLQFNKKESLDSIATLRVKLETQFGYTIEVDRVGFPRIIGVFGLNKQTAEQLYNLFKIANFKFYTVDSDDQKSRVFNASKLLQDFEYITIDFVD